MAQGRHMRVMVLKPGAVVRSFTVALAVSGCAAVPHQASSPTALTVPVPWFPTWSPSQSPSTPQPRPAAGTRDPVPTYANATLRQVAHTSIGGDRVRIHISNEYGDRPLVIG